MQWIDRENGPGKKVLNVFPIQGINTQETKLQELQNRNFIDSLIPLLLLQFLLSIKCLKGNSAVLNGANKMFELHKTGTIPMFGSTVTISAEYGLHFISLKIFFTCHGLPTLPTSQNFSPI
ncbi:hypothetical protein IEQ34_007881 [Dendrobium chrysotoxum]|uniref:Uncharacterized protein n=1 Tax=Dendrobium chrysotoxum TaxID=161865 RepID=A0AAV7H5C1_DENCH|nr:hypothetical protein IEQ34_007881 [Dendrobium chrysotoxum]